MKSTFALLSSVLLAVAVHGQGLPPISIWVPGEYASSPGNFLQTGPFREHTTQAPGRYQQVFAASEFAVIPDGGYITGFTLRRRGNGWFEGDSSSFQITMSTTQTQPDSLSPVFALNTGPDPSVVFGPSELSFRAATSIGDNRVVAFATPFLYQPSRGNLLMDLQNLSGNDLFYDDRTPDAGDSVYAIGDSVSCVFNVGNVTSGLVDSRGYIVQFQIQPIPEPVPAALLLGGLVVCGVLNRFRRGFSQERD